MAPAGNTHFEMKSPISLTQLSGQSDFSTCEPSIEPCQHRGQDKTRQMQRPTTPQQDSAAELEDAVKMWDA